MWLWKLTLIALLVICSMAIGKILDLVINNNSKLDFIDGIAVSVLVGLVIGSGIALMLL